MNFFLMQDRLTRRYTGEATEDNRKIARAVMELAPVGKLLDLGGGGGIYSSLFAGAGYDVTMVELVPEFCETARADARLKVVCGDMFTADLGAGYDVVTCLGEVLGGLALKDQMRLAGRVRELLKRGGLAVFSVVSPGWWERNAEDGLTTMQTYYPGTQTLRLTVMDGENVCTHEVMAHTLKDVKGILARGWLEVIQTVDLGPVYLVKAVRAI